MITRRNTMKVLGLSTAAVGIERAAGATEHDSRTPVHKLSTKETVSALREFADALERGEFALVSLSVHSTISPGDVANNELRVSFLNRGVG